MTGCELSVDRDRLGQYRKVLFCLLPLGVGWLLLKFVPSIRKSFSDFAASYHAEITEEHLKVSYEWRWRNWTLGRVRSTVPRNRVTNVVLCQGPILARMNLWSLHIQTAGLGANSAAEVRIDALADPEGVHEQILSWISASSQAVAD